MKRKRCAEAAGVLAAKCHCFGYWFSGRAGTMNSSVTEADSGRDENNRPSAANCFSAFTLVTEQLPKSA